MVPQSFALTLRIAFAIPGPSSAATGKLAQTGTSSQKTIVEHRHAIAIWQHQRSHISRRKLRGVLHDKKIKPLSTDDNCKHIRSLSHLRLEGMVWSRTAHWLLESCKRMHQIDCHTEKWTSRTSTCAHSLVHRNLQPKVRQYCLRKGFIEIHLSG